MDSETTTPTEEKKAPVPRGPNPENQRRLDYIVQRTKEVPGITSPTIAKELGISTLQCSQLTDRLVKAGTIVIKKVGPIRTNYPAGYPIPEDPAPEAAPATQDNPTGSGDPML